jgi:hypothetical protein
MRNRQARIAGSLMIAGAVLANVAFTLLGSRFSYPDVLREPAADILRSFHADARPVGALFALLALASATLIPVALLSRGLIATDRARVRRVMVVAGTAAGIVQVIGLMRWPFLVPHLAHVVADPATSAAARADAVDTFQILHTVLGGVVGETFGYALTAIWTIAMVRGLAVRPGRWFAPLGYASAALIATGLLEPLGLAGAGLANFIGYIAWSAWMIGVGTSLLRHGATDAVASSSPGGRRPAVAAQGAPA